MRMHKFRMDNQLIKELQLQVKQNKKYHSIADEIIQDEINSYLKKNKITEISKQDIKEIRNQLHKSYASFQTRHKNKIKQYLEELRENTHNKEIINKLLSITLSTKERLDSYSEIYPKIFQITGTPKTILDLGCGFNPFSYPLMNLKNLSYYAYDINEEDINCLNEYFKIMKTRGLTGTAKILNINDKEKLSCLPPSNIILLFKVIDILDKNNHKPSEELIKILINKTSFIVASFATKTLTRRTMNHLDRKWFELMLQRNNLNFQTIKTDNEIFYVINEFHISSLVILS